MTLTTKILSGSVLALAAGTMLFATIAAEARGGRGLGGEPMSFEALDTNKDGELTLEELKDRAAVRFAATDTDSDGSLSRDELIARANNEVSSRVDRIIARFDSDGNGMLSEAELNEGREGRANTEKFAERMLKRVDANEDGVISAEEFAKTQERHSQKWGARSQ